MKYKVTNWPTYEVGLRRRGSLTLWVTPEALERGKRHDEKPDSPAILIWRLRRF
jgi:hypothetical protein